MAEKSLPQTQNRAIFALRRNIELNKHAEKESKLNIFYCKNHEIPYFHIIFYNVILVILINHIKIFFNKIQPF